MTEETFWTTERTGALDAKLDPKLTAQRQAFGAGQGGRKLTYLEGHAAIAQLNRLFGYGGWSYSVDEMGVDEYTQGPQEQWSAGFWAIVTLRVGGVSRQDVGCTEVQNTGKGGSVRDNVHNVDSRSTARKGAVTDALKRAARTFGQQLGNGLYDVDDDVYAWMTAHSLDEGEGESERPADSPPAPAARNGGGTGAAATLPQAKAAAARASRSGPQAVTASIPQPSRAEQIAALRTQVAGLLQADTEAAGKLPKGAEAMTEEDLVKARVWLMNRAAQARAAAQHDASAPEPEPIPVDEHAALRAEVIALLADDGPALALLQQAGKPLPPEQDAATLATTKTWLEKRARLRVPLPVRLRDAIARAASADEVTRAVADARGGQERKEITEAEYKGLYQAGEARKVELSAPLLSGSGAPPQGQGRTQVAS